MTDEMCRVFVSISIYDKDGIEIKIQLSSQLACKFRNPHDIASTGAMVPMVPALLVVLCCLLPSLPCAVDCRIHRGHEEPHIATQVFDVHQLCLNGKQTTFLAGKLS